MASAEQTADKPAPGPGPARILVVKLSALGDFVLSIASFQAIRRHHPAAAVTLLTTAPYRDLAAASGCFDEVWTDPRPRPWQPAAWLRLRRQLAGGRFDRIYDLQRSDRTGWYFRLLPRPRPEWVGIARGCSHRYRPPSDRVLHIAAREAAQLALAGLPAPGLPDLGFLGGDLTAFDLPERFALLVPGGAPHRLDKRWPAERYAELARTLAAEGLVPLLLGTAAEAESLQAIARACPAARDLCGATDLAQLASLARGATLAVGNDTGPMHLIAAAGAPSLVLFSEASDPRKVAPRGPRVAVLQRPNLTDLRTGEVLAAAEALRS